MRFQPLHYAGLEDSFGQCARLHERGQGSTKRSWRMGTALHLAAIDSYRKDTGLVLVDPSTLGQLVLLCSSLRVKDEN